MSGWKGIGMAVQQYKFTKRDNFSLFWPANAQKSVQLESLGWAAQLIVHVREQSGLETTTL